MKFTKEEAYKELVARLTAKGEKLNLSERSINEQLETLIALVANDETEMSDFIDSTFALFKTADANVRNDVSAGINDYITKNPTVVDPKPTNNGGDDAFSKRLEALEKQLADAERKQKMSEMKNDILSRMKAKGVKNEEWAVALLDELSLQDEINIDDKVEAYVKLYNQASANVSSGASPWSAGGNTRNEYINDVISGAADFAKSQRLVD